MKEIVDKIESLEMSFDEANHYDFSGYDKNKLKEIENFLSKYSLEKNTKQMALKISLNSLYGAQANQHFPLFNRDSAASITFMGRYLIQRTGEKVNENLLDKFGEDDYWVYSDTDSVGFESIVRTNNYGNKQIGLLFDEIEGEEIKKGENQFIKYINEEILTYSINPQTKKIEAKQISYMWKHLVEKEMFKIEIDDKKVRVTEDHSIIVEDEEGNIVPKKPNELKETDFLIFFEENLINFQKTNNFKVKSLGKIKEWVYDIEVEDNHNFFANDILVHNSCYFSLENIVSKVIEKKFQGKKWQDMNKDERESLIKAILKIIDAYIQPFVDETVNETLNYANSPQKGFMGAKVEKVNIAGIHIAKKRYALLTVWNEGTFLIDKPKLSVTGLEIVRSSTPDFCIDALEKSLHLIISEGEEAIQKYIKSVRKEFYDLCEKDPEKVSRTSGVSNMEYVYEDGKWLRYDEKGNKIPCPINSRAAIIHNKAVIDYNLGEFYTKIVPGDKIKYVMLKEPNILNSNIFGYTDQGILFDLGLIENIDKEEMFNKNFIQPLKLILNAVNFSIEKKSDINEWV